MKKILVSELNGKGARNDIGESVKRGARLASLQN